VSETTASTAPIRLLTPTFVALFVAALAFFTSGGMVLPVAVRYAAGPLAADETGIGISIGAFAIAALAMRPVVGWASDRFGRRPLLILGGAGTVGALALHLAADTLPLFVVARSLLGIAEAFFFVALVAAISDLAPVDRRGEAINVGSLAVYLGLAIGPFLGESVLSAADFAAVWVAAAVAALAATLLSVFVPETAPSVLAARDGRRPRGRLFHPAGLFPGFLVLTGAWGMAGFLAFIPLHASAVGMDGAGLVLAVYALVVMVLRVAFVSLPDRMGAARLSGTALAVSAVGLAVIAVAGEPILLVVGTAVFAGGIAFMFPALIALAVSRVDENERGSVVGTTSAFLDLSFGLAPALLGAVASSSGLPVVFLLSAGVAVVGCLAMVVRRSTLAPAAA
jgi:MFS family permease